MINLIFPLLISLISIPLLIKISNKYNLQPIPDKDRWNTTPTPLMGGTAIYLSILMFLNKDLFVCVSSLWAFGIFDDRINTQSAYPKLVIHITLAWVTILLGYQFHWFGNWIDLLITMFWIVGMINACNLIDNMDGMLASTGVICGVVFGILLTGDMSLLAFALAISMAVFMLYNAYPSSIWMGDSGSMFIGYLFAIFSMSYSDGVYKEFSMMPFLLLWFPIIDTIFVIITRTMRGQKFWIGDRTHLAHRLSVMYGGNDFLSFAAIFIMQLMVGLICYAHYG